MSPPIVVDFLEKGFASLCFHKQKREVPSAIFGLFGIAFIVPFIRDYISLNRNGCGLLPSSIVFSITALPTMASIGYDALSAVDPSYYEGALSLGSTKEMAMFKAVLSAAKNGIFAALVPASDARWAKRWRSSWSRATSRG